MSDRCQTTSLNLSLARLSHLLTMPGGSRISASDWRLPSGSAEERKLRPEPDIRRPPRRPAVVPWNRRLTDCQDDETARRNVGYRPAAGFSGRGLALPSLSRHSLPLVGR
jgi:hypothetical protein